MKITVNGEDFIFDEVKSKEQQDGYNRREQHVMWVMSGGMFGKRDESEPESLFNPHL
jgi:hypothetical protein